MFSAKSLLIVNVLFVACQALALDYPDNEIAPIEDAFDLEKDNTVIVQGVDNIDNFQREHPELTLEELDVLSNVRGQMVYTLGNRAAGDRLVGKAARKQTWSTKQNVKIQLTYPSRGVGAMVTYVHIVVNQVINQLFISLGSNQYCKLKKQNLSQWLPSASIPFVLFTL